jgi:hypothetical protein
VHRVQWQKHTNPLEILSSYCLLVMVLPPRKAWRAQWQSCAADAGPGPYLVWGYASHIWQHPCCCVAQQGFDLIWYGDSITYWFTQGSYRQQAWAYYFGQYRSGIFGVPGDGTAVLWRHLINGEAPKARWLVAHHTAPLDSPWACLRCCTFCMQWTPTPG